jgi:hypothetical protein
MAIHDLCIHGHVVLMFWTIVLNIWMHGLTKLHGNIMLGLQTVYQIIFGNTCHLTNIEPSSKLDTILGPRHTLLGQGGQASTFETKKQKQ